MTIKVGRTRAAKWAKLVKDSGGWAHCERCLQRLDPARSVHIMDQTSDHCSECGMPKPCA